MEPSCLKRSVHGYVWVFNFTIGTCWGVFMGIFITEPPAPCVKSTLTDLHVVHFVVLILLLFWLLHDKTGYHGCMVHYLHRCLIQYYFTYYAYFL
ncbi:hypothetical protein GDO86_018918 [Hymenochirus boettgeri]|uniref:Uncharacterized protein n=1 Tax=Hymenochirus boettgeri TaxID=247094 RepID=A0A8T2I6T0_9PIPI|nr:hypothetical protein GDO86_018918 [Hymenochirus boettgeri]